MALNVIASASTIDVKGAEVAEVSGTTTINTITGVHDGQRLTPYFSGTLTLSSSGNISATTTTTTPGYPAGSLRRRQRRCLSLPQQLLTVSERLRCPTFTSILR